MASPFSVGLEGVPASVLLCWREAAALCEDAAALEARGDLRGAFYAYRDAAGKLTQEAAADLKRAGEDDRADGAALGRATKQLFAAGEDVFAHCARLQAALQRAGEDSKDGGGGGDGGGDGSDGGVGKVPEDSRAEAVRSTSVPEVDAARDTASEHVAAAKAAEEAGDLRAAYYAYRNAAQAVLEVQPALQRAKGMIPEDSWKKIKLILAGDAKTLMTRAWEVSQRIATAPPAAEFERGAPVDSGGSGGRTASREEFLERQLAAEREARAAEREARDDLARRYAELEAAASRRPAALSAQKSLRTLEIRPSADLSLELPEELLGGEAAAEVSVAKKRDLYDTAGGVSAWVGLRRRLHTDESKDRDDEAGGGADVPSGQYRVILYSAPILDQESATSISQHLYTLCRLSQRGVVSVVKPSAVRFDLVSHPTWGHVQAAIVECPCPPTAVTLGGWIAAAKEQNADTPACGKPSWQVQAVFGQLLGTVCQLHASGTVGCLHRDNIWVVSGSDNPTMALESSVLQLRVVPLPVDHSDGAIPFPPSFGGAGPVSGCGARITGVDSGDACVDMYLIGSWLYEAYFGTAPTLMPDQAAVSIPAGVPGTVGRMSVRVEDVLSRLLRRDPSAVLSAFEAAQHPAFTVSIAEDMKSETKESSSEERAETLRAIIAPLELSESRIAVKVRRTFIVETATDAIMRTTATDLRKKMAVSFEGEDGIDAGGLTVELYEAYFSALFSESNNLFSAEFEGVANPLFLPAGPLGDSTRVTVAALRVYEATGRLLIKSIFDGNPVPARFAPSLYKYLLGQEPNLHDLDAFSPRLGQWCRKLMQMSEAEVEEAGALIDFGDVGGDESMDLSLSNRKEYVKRLIQWELVGSRKASLEAFKEGFERINIVKPLMHIFRTPTELMTLIVGEQDLAADDVVARLKFERYRFASKLPRLFKAAVGKLSDQDLRRFLRYVTATAILPPPGKSIVIRNSARTEALFTAHTCFNRLDVPDLKDGKEVQRRLQLCLDNLENAGFGVA